MWGYPKVLHKYIDYVCKLEFKAKPDYKIRFLGAALDDLSSEPYSKLKFAGVQGSSEA